jgi:hypothetical protein
VNDERVDVLVLAADGTAASDELEQALRERANLGPVAFTLLVPATPEGVSRVADLEPDPDHAERQARPALERLRGAGLEVEARIGDSEPVSAAEDALNFGDYQEVIVATTTRTVTKLARMDLARRVEAATSLPVTHVTASKADGD